MENVQALDHVFIDVDGVILDFESLLLPVFEKNGITPPSVLQMASRQEDFISAAFPHVVDRYKEAELVQEVFASGALKTQSMYSFLCKDTLNRLISAENVYILTKLDPNYVTDRIKCFKEIHGIDISAKILTVWTDMTKGERILKFCEENNIPHTNAVLIDDRHDNLESALKLGSKGLLVERSYNEAHRKRLKDEYQERFSTVKHKSLMDRLEDMAENDGPYIPLQRAY